jgi:uncharacterized membrane protein
MTYLPLLGIALVVLGFALRFNPLLVVVVAAIATGLLSGMDFVKVLSAIGKGFNDNRSITVVFLVLPVIGLLERYGLQQRARSMIESMRGATAGRLLIAYLGFRQVFAALGLTSVAGHAQTVRPLVAPMAEAAAEKEHGKLDEQTNEKVKALSSATDNVGAFFGEDIFVAVGSVLLIQGSMAGFGIVLTPLQLSLWAIPTAIAAFLIHGARLLWFDASLRRHPRGSGGPAEKKSKLGSRFRGNDEMSA